jgi:hypothetical protein
MQAQSWKPDQQRSEKASHSYQEVEFGKYGTLVWRCALHEHTIANCKLPNNIHDCTDVDLLQICSLARSLPRCARGSALTLHVNGAAAGTASTCYILGKWYSLRLVFKVCPITLRSNHPSLYNCCAIHYQLFAASEDENSFAAMACNGTGTQATYSY